MRWLALLLQLPLFTVLGWLYWRFPESLPRSRARRRYDVGVIAIAAITSTLALLAAVDAPYADGAGPIWAQVVAVLAAFHVFPLVLFLGWWVRNHRFAPSEAPGEGRSRR